MGTYPPTQCGLATFTESLVRALDRQGSRTGVLRLLEAPRRERPAGVIGDLVLGDRPRREDLAPLADFDATVFQHEYGIWGPADGEAVVEALEACPTPAVVVAHTVLREPTRGQRRVLTAVAERAERMVVMSHVAATRLQDVFGADPSRIAVIPHGAVVDSSSPGRAGHPTVLTWGLLGPGKGIEWGIEAMTYLADLDPAPHYVVAGQTHPKVRERQGEAYRRSLQERAEAVGVADRVSFVDRYLDQDDLLRLARSADVVLLPYDSTEQVTSGVLVDAVARGRPVVATAFPHAEELLAGTGRVVPQRDPAAIADVLRRLLTDAGAWQAAAAHARALAPDLAWPAVGRRYLELASSLGAPVESVAGVTA